MDACKVPVTEDDCRKQKIRVRKSREKRWMDIAQGAARYGRP